MELVLLADVQNGYGSSWIRIANTAGVEDIHIGDCFREQGFGKGAEELKVAGVDISKVGGFSKLFVDRGANATQPEVHRLGCVFEMVGIAPAVELVVTDVTNYTAPPSYSIHEQAAGTPRRGRPAGSKNKPKAEPVETLAGFP